MAKATRSIQETAIWCDEDGCERKAQGPCIHCGKDLCSLHGDLNGGHRLEIGSTRILVCPAAVAEMNIRELGEAARYGRQRWADFYQRGGLPVPPGDT